MENETLSISRIKDSRTDRRDCRFSPLPRDPQVPRAISRSTAGSPSPTSEPFPSSWMPAELRFDPSALGALPPLPPHLVSKVYRHKSAVGTDPARALHYETESYKPLEFFGDAVIEFQVSRVLGDRFPRAGPGLLTFLRRRIVDNRTLAVLGWHAGLAPHIRFGSGSPFARAGGAHCPSSIVAEVFEAYFGALARDPATRDSLDSWFDDFLGPNSRVFPDMDTDAREREEQMEETVRNKTGMKLERLSDGSTTAVAVPAPAFTCECSERPNSAPLFSFKEQDRSDVSKKGAGFWHTTITHNGQKVACGRGGKRLDARQEAWATGLARALNIIR